MPTEIFISKKILYRIIFLQRIFICFIFFCGFSFTQNTTYILIHGTWSHASSWYQEGGDFFDALYTSIDNDDEIISFSWSGALSERARHEAADMLLSLLESIDLESIENNYIVLVGHSHGGNIALSAARLLDKKDPEKRIYAIVLLGTPQYYQVNIPENVDFIFNLFSFGDMVQPVFNVFRREISESSNTANISLFLEGREPDHHRLYHPLIGLYIPQMIHLSTDQKKEIAAHPHSASFSWLSGFQLISDIDRKDKIKQDLFMQERLLTNILWGPTEAVYFYP